VNHEQIDLPDGGQFSYVITDENLNINLNGNLIYIYSIHHLNENKDVIFNTNFVERMLIYIRKNLPQIEYIRLNVSSEKYIPIIQKSIFKVFGKTIFMEEGSSINIKIK
jgi:hypothetical protein